MDWGIWVQNGIIGLVGLGGVVAYIHNRLDAAKKDQDEALSKLDTKGEAERKKLEERLENEKKELMAMIEVERAERRRDVDRVEKALIAMQQVPNQLSLMGSDLKHLFDRFSDDKVSRDKDMEEVKHTVRNIAQKVGAIELSQARQQAEHKWPTP